MQQIKIDVEKGQKSYYVYLLFKPDGTPFYVGKGKSNRISAHEAETRYFINRKTWKGMNTFKLNTIKKIWKEKGQVFYQIDSWHDVSELAGEREVELVKQIGRRILNEGTLTNIRDGGEVWSEETRKLFSEKMKKYWADHPMTKGMKDQISESMKDYIVDHPEFIEHLQKTKNEWIKDHPEEHEEDERKRLEIFQSQIHRDKKSEIMTKYFKNNPEELDRLIAQGAEFWEDNSEARAEARERAIKNKSHEAIIHWLATETENCREKWDRHSEHMKKWYKDNPDRAEKLAEDRNKVLRSDSHRHKMSQATSDWIKSDPEGHKLQRKRAQETVDKKKAVRAECLELVRMNLVREGKIKDLDRPATDKMVHNWRRKGLMPKDFPYGSSLTISDWTDYRSSL